LPLIATLALTGCSSSEERNPNTPQSSWLESIPVVYRQDIQQGNIVTQENVNRLEPGMSKRQVRFILGTPMLTDVFHADRWDYLYSMTEGWGDREQKRLTVYFKDDQLISVEGDYRPQPADQQTGPKKETVVSVPDCTERIR
jgi:outer membrane protein assembly factor BamE